MPEVEEEIVCLDALPFDELVARGRISQRAHPHFVRPETLMHFLRRTRSDNRDQRFNTLYGLVLARMILALPRSERIVSDRTIVDASAKELEDRVRHRFNELVAIDRAGGDRMDFYEVHFDEAVAKLRMKTSKPVVAERRRNEPLELDPETGEIAEHVERAAGAFDEPDDQFLFDPIFRKRLYAEIDRLKREQMSVMTMLLAGMQIHSDDPNVPTIARALGCDAKTVRNRRNAAIRELRKALGLGDGT
jgi:hypothetical protein